MSLRPQLKTPDASPSPVDPGLKQTRPPRLTQRECEVMHWVSEGKRDREIAVILELSPRTVEKHVCHILEKLQVETRTAAVNECRHLVSRSRVPSKNTSLHALTDKRIGERLIRAKR